MTASAWRNPFPSQTNSTISSRPGHEHAEETVDMTLQRERVPNRDGFVRSPCLRNSCRIIAMTLRGWRDRSRPWIRTFPIPHWPEARWAEWDYPPLDREDAARSRDDQPAASPGCRN